MKLLKYLLSPLWLILFLAKWVCLIVTGFVSGIMRFLGIGALSVGVALWLMASTLRSPAVQLLIAGMVCVLLPYVGSVIIGVLEAGHTLLGDWIID